MKRLSFIILSGTFLQTLWLTYNDDISLLYRSKRIFFPFLFSNYETNNGVGVDVGVMAPVILVRRLRCGV